MIAAGKSPWEGYVRLYEDQWRADHASAMRRRALEDVLELGSRLGGGVLKTALRWREAVARGEEPHTPEDEETFLDLLRHWEAVCDLVLERTSEYEGLYDVVGHAAAFRRRALRAKKLLAGWTRPVLQQAAALHVQELTSGEAAEAEEQIARGVPGLARVPRSLGESTP